MHPFIICVCECEGTGLLWDTFLAGCTVRDWEVVCVRVGGVSVCSRVGWHDFVNGLVAVEMVRVQDSEGM